jgi:hypothetical protein
MQRPLEPPYPASVYRVEDFLLGAEGWDMASPTIVAFFERPGEAGRAVRALEESGVRSGAVSLVANGDEVASRAPEGAGIGAAIGAVLGTGASLIAAAGLLPIPGIGPVLAAGPLAAALAGAGVGAAAGGVVGGLVAQGVPEDDATRYAEGVRRGGALITVACGAARERAARSRRRARHRSAKRDMAAHALERGRSRA